MQAPLQSTSLALAQAVAGPAQVAPTGQQPLATQVKVAGHDVPLPEPQQVLRAGMQNLLSHGWSVAGHEMSARAASGIQPRSGGSEDALA